MRKRKHEFSSVFAEHIERYLRFMRGLERAFRVEDAILRAFDAFVCEREYDGDLTQEIAIDFAYSKPGLTSVQYAKRYRILRNFSEYLSVYNPGAPLFDPKAVRGRVERHPAHIYTDEEIALLLSQAKALGPANSPRPIVYHTLLGLLLSTGMRIGEAIKLNVHDVDLKEGLINVRETKFRKNRIVPVHDTTLRQLREYMEARNRFLLGAEQNAFFVNGRRKRLCYSTVVATFIHLARASNIRSESGQGPRLHDLRHTFAVRRVLSWYDANDDIQAQLPALSTYMGHAHFEDTTYYLTAGAELMARASGRFENYWRDEE